MKNKFISLEGGEGVGKTSILNHLKQYFEQNNIPYLFTREPGGTTIGESVRSIILDKSNTNMSLECEALLFASSRIQLLNEKIKPALEQGMVVVCDRYVDSSLAYQGYARGLGIEEVENINSFAMRELPDCTIWIDLDPEIGLERIAKNHRVTDRLDLETIEFHKRVYEGYKILRDKYKDRYYTVDGNQPLENVLTDCLKIVQEVLKES